MRKRLARKMLVCAVLASWAAAPGWSAITSWDDVKSTAATTGGTITLPSNMTVTSPIESYQTGTVIDGNGATIDGNQVQVLNTAGQSGTTISIINATIQNSNGNAYGGGALNNDNGNTLIIGEKNAADGTLSNAVILSGNNAPGAYGGSAVRNNNATLTINDNVQFNDNYSADMGSPFGGGGNAGAVSNWGTGSVTIGDNVQFSGNGYTDSSKTAAGAYTGGAIYNDNSVTIGDNANISGNAASAGGGAIYNGGGYDRNGSNAASLTIGNNAVISNNISGGEGGAIYSQRFNETNTNTVTIGEGAQFSGNQANGGAGGAITAYSSTVDVGAGSSFTDNISADNGGAIYSDTYGFDASTSVTNIGAGATFSGNEAVKGGAIYNGAGSLVLDTTETTLADGTTVSDITFTGNTASDSGADLYQGSGASTSIQGGADTTLSMDGGIAGEGTITKSGENTFVLGGDSSKYTGAYTQDAGKTVIDGKFFSGESVFNAGELELTADAELNHNLTIAGAVDIAVAKDFTVDWTTGDITVGSYVLDVADDVNNMGLTISGTHDDNMVIGEGKRYSSIALSNATLTGTLQSDNGNVLIDNTSTQTINGPSEIKNYTEGTAAIVNDGTLNLDSTGGNITFKDNGKDIANNGDMTISGTNTVTFKSGLTGGGVDDSATIELQSGNVDFAEGSVSDYTGSYTQTDGKTTVSGEFISGTATINGGEFVLNNSGKLNSDVVIGTNTPEVTISKSITGIANAGTDGSITIADSEGFDLGANKLDLIVNGGANSALTDIDAIGGVANIQDLTFNGGAGLAEDEEILVQGTTLTFGSGTTNHASNTITLNDENSVLNLGNANDNGTINLEAEILNNSADATINKDYNTLVNIIGDKSDYDGKFSQTAGTTVITDGAYFFGGDNTVSGGDLVLENGGHFAEGSVNNVVGAGLSDPYGTLVLKNDELGPENTVIDWASGKVTITDSPSDDPAPYTNEITIDKGGLHLANGWVQESNYEEGFTLFENQTGIRELELSNGSGVRGNIAANDHSILTYNDGAFIDNKATIAMGDDVAVNLNFNEDTVFDTNIVTATQGGVVSNINKNGNGNVSMAKAIGDAASGAYVNTNLNVNGGEMTLRGDVAILGDINLKENTGVISNGFVSAKDVNANKAVVSASKDLNLTGNLNLANDSAANLYGSNNNIAGSVDANNSALTAANNVNITGDLTMNNAKIDLTAGNKAASAIVGGTTTITGNNTLSVNADGRDYSAGGIKTDVLTTNGQDAVITLGDINFVATPRDYNFTLKVIDAQDDQAGDKLKIVTDGKLIDTPVGKYSMLAGDGGRLFGTLESINPQAYRGQVATVASYANQLVHNNLMFDHINIVSQQLIAQERTANKYAAIEPQFSPYQYSATEGSLWYKAYGNFETISMTRGLNVHNNAYGSLIGADFPLVKLNNGWKLIPTAYVSYNGAHQTFNGVGMYQNGGQLGVMGTAYKGDFLTSLLAYGGGYYNSMNVAGKRDNTGNWFAGVASKSAYNFHLPADFIIQPTMLLSYNIFGEQNWHSNYGIIGMSSGMLNGINIAPGTNIIWNKETFSIYATAQLVFNIMGDVKGQAGNIYLPSVGYRHVAYFEYGLGATKRIKERLNSFIQFTIRNGTRTGIGFQGGLQWKI